MLLYGLLFIVFILLLLLFFLYKEFDRAVNRQMAELSKFKYFNVLNSRWLHNIMRGRRIEDYLLRNNFRRVAVYGLGELGRLVCEELKNSEVEVQYIIDRNEKKQYEGIEVVRLSEKMAPVDGIIVTVGEGYGNIEDSIKRVVDYTVLPLEKILFDNE